MQEDETVTRGVIGRAVGFASIILVLALLGGAAFVFYDYVREHGAKTWSEREWSREQVENDTTTAMKLRFLIGAGLGASVGILYAVHCIRRGEQP